MESVKKQPAMDIGFANKEILCKLCQKPFAIGERMWKDGPGETPGVLHSACLHIGGLKDKDIKYVSVTSNMIVLLQEPERILYRI